MAARCQGWAHDTSSLDLSLASGVSQASAGSGAQSLGTGTQSSLEGVPLKAQLSSRSGPGTPPGHSRHPAQGTAGGPLRSYSSGARSWAQAWAWALSAHCPCRPVLGKQRESIFLQGHGPPALTLSCKEPKGTPAGSHQGWVCAQGLTNYFNMS